MGTEILIMQTLYLHHLFFTNEKKRETADFSTEADSAALKIIKIKTSTWIALILISLSLKAVSEVFLNLKNRYQCRFELLFSFQVFKEST